MLTRSKSENIEAIIPIDTLVHLGAGRCSEIDDYMALHPRTLLLVEADPQLAMELQSRTEDLKQAQVICVAVAGQPGPATFNRYNLPDVNSLHPASNLLNLFPGLKTVGRLQVEAVTPTKLLQPLHLKSYKENWLVIDLPGEELPVLRCLQQSQQLYLFSQVKIHCGCEPLYVESGPASRLVESLLEEGYDLLAVDDNQDPDRPCWTFQRNSLQLKNRHLQQQVEAHKKQLEQETFRNEEHTKQAAKLKAQVQRLKQERNAQINRSADRQFHIEELTKANDEKVRFSSELQQQVEQLIKLHNEQAKLAADRQRQIDQLTQDGGNNFNLIRERQTYIEQLNRSIGEAKMAVAEQHKALDSLMACVGPKQLGERISQLEKLLSRIESEIAGREIADKQAEKQKLPDEVKFLHRDCAWLRMEVAAFLSGGSPSAPICVNSERLGLLGALLSLVGLNKKAQEITHLSAETFVIIREIDELILSDTISSVLFDKLNKIDYDPVIVAEYLFNRVSELLALSLVAVGDYKFAMRIFSELLRFSSLDKLFAELTKLHTGWLIKNYDKRLTLNVLGNLSDVSELVSFFTRDGKVKEKTKFFWCQVLANYYHFKKDNLKACHFHSLALKYSTGNVWLAKQCVEALVEMNQATHAIRLWINNLFEKLDISASEKTTIFELFEKTSSKMEPIQDHGHVALMKAIDENLSIVRQRIVDRKPVLIEIGTTREIVNGQGSTERLARFCHDRKIHFLTVDMDHVNIDSAREFVQKIDPEFELIVAKGEDYLAEHEEQIDFIFLDAYDFDHGKHSDERQARYEKVLGERINDKACHRMHLDCATSLVSKLSPWGLIAFDDVWFRDSSWHGKGTTAMPYLLANGFHIIYLANNVAILARSG